MSELVKQLADSNALAALPPGELIAKCGRQQHLIDQMAERLDEVTAERMRLERVARASDELLRAQQDTIEILRSSLKVLQEKLARERRMHLVVDNQQCGGEVSMFHRRQAE
jgi:hypothetical protein